MKKLQSRETGYIRYGTQDEGKQNKNVNQTSASYKQLEVKTNRTSFLCGNCNGCHNSELRK